MSMWAKILHFCPVLELVRPPETCSHIGASSWSYQKLHDLDGESPLCGKDVEEGHWKICYAACHGGQARYRM